MNTKWLRNANITTRVAVMLILLQGVLYGLGEPVSKAVFAVMPVYSMISIRYVVALIVLMLCFGREIVDGYKKCSVRDWLPPSLCMGFTCLFNNMALELTTATTISFLRSLSTVITPLLAVILLHRRYSWKHFPIQVFVVVGLYLMCGVGNISGFGLGEVLGLVTALLTAGGLVYGKRALRRVEPIVLTACQTAVSALIAAICAVIFNGGWPLEVITPQVGGSILFLAVFCTIGGYFLQNAALGKLPARTVALLQCFCPVITAVFARIILGERLTVAGTIGAGIILFCVVAETWLGREAD